jgi:limonene 1,2-monooxygenase
MFLAAAGERSANIKLGTGVVSLPYHHPFHVAQRFVQLDLMTNGRAILGTGPGALASDAHTLGIDPLVLRDRQDEGIGVLKRLFAGERFTYECEWFNMYDARLHTLPLQEEVPMAVASMISPSGMTLAGKYGSGALSIGTVTTAGIASLPLQWSFAEESAAKHGQTVDRRDWRIVFNWHIAESREEARKQAMHGLHRWYNEYTVQTLAPETGKSFETPEETMEVLAGEEGPLVIGTPDDLIQRIREMQDVSGGFGTVIGFVNDFASPDNIAKSWDMVARYVVPEVNGLLKGFRESRAYVINNREPFQRAGQAVLNKIKGHERAHSALKEGGLEGRTASAPLPAHASHYVDDDD